MFLLSPAWLAALGALAVPIVVHLISRGRYRRLRIGSVRLLSPDESRRGSSFRPSQLLLLLVRCLLLAAVALALADIRRWADPPSGDPESIWILASPEVLSRRAELEAAHPDAYRRLDELRAGGGELRLLAPGLPPAEAGVLPPETGGDLWSLLREADRAVPTGTAFHLFAVDRVAALRGERPRLRRSVEWTLLAAASENRWIERAGPVKDDVVPVVLGASDAGGTTFRRAEVRLRAGTADDELELLPGPRVRLRDGGSLASDDEVSLDAGPQVLEALVLFDPDREDDASYVVAALEAVSSHARVPVAVRSRVLKDGAPPQGESAPLRFWLSAAPVPARFRGEGRGVVVSDGLGTHESIDLPAVLPGGSIRLRRRSETEAVQGGAVLWRDAAGQPLLSASRAGEGRWYRLHGRFHPSWSDLPLDAAFPEWLASLVADLVDGPMVRSARTDSSDRRAGARLASLKAGMDPGTERRQGRGPEAALWLLAGLLLGLERWMSARASA